LAAARALDLDNQSIRKFQCFGRQAALSGKLQGLLGRAGVRRGIRLLGKGGQWIGRQAVGIARQPVDEQAIARLAIKRVAKYAFNQYRPASPVWDKINPSFWLPQ
jgi:hypothetical protein